MLQLQPMLEDYPEEDLQIITITSDSEERIKDFWEEENIPGEVFIDATGELSRQYEVQYLPEGIFIDREGTIKHESTGWQEGSLEEWQQKADNLLGTD